LIREAENVVPGLEKAILAMDVATPLTFEEQGGRSGEPWQAGHGIMKIVRIIVPGVW